MHRKGRAVVVAFKARVLIVEDEADLAELIRYNLSRAGYECGIAGNGISALEEIRRDPPDLVVLDRMLPGLSGDSVITKLRRDPRTAGVLTIMLTAKAEESDELSGFALGADDYVTKPFSMELLLARIEAGVRRLRAPAEPSEVLTAGSLNLDRSRRELRADGIPIVLTSTEFDLLWELMAARGRVLSREQIINAVLGATAVVTDRTIDVHVAALRKKLGAAASVIKTVRGVGYAVRTPGGDDE